MRILTAIVAALMVATASSNLLTPTTLGSYLRDFQPLTLGTEQVLVYANVRTRSLPTLHAKPFSVRFHAYNRDFELNLSVDDTIFAPGFTASAINGDGTKSTIDISDRQYYTGSVAGESHSFAHFRVALDGSIFGLFTVGKEGFYIDPVSHHFSTPQSFDHVIFRSSDHVYNRTGLMDKLVSGFHDPSPYRSRRSSGYVSGKATCGLNLVADSAFYTNIGSSNIGNTMDAVVARFTTCKTLFESTTFQYPVYLKIQNFQVYTTSDPIAGSRSTGEAFLDAISAINYQILPYPCLTHVFTYHTFPSGLLGLAWVGDSGNTVGGICQAPFGSPAQYTNTGFSTSENFNTRMETLMSALVMAHEMGHGFGSTHDESGVGDDTSGAGRYLMWPYAVDGDAPNNAHFSSSSIGKINAVLTTKAGCFLTNSSSNCGNAIQEGLEQCDCGGSSTSCATLDACCNPYNSATPATNCKLAATKVCSPHHTQNGACCNDNCSFKTSGTVCAVTTECKQQSTCDSIGNCPTQNNFADRTLCKSNTNMCNNGACADSICTLWSLTECTTIADHTNPKYKCLKGCSQSSVCKSTSVLGAVTNGANPTFQNGSTYDVTGIAFYKAPGDACEYTSGQPTSGVCDATNTCISADTETGFLDDLKNKAIQFAKQFFAAALLWAKRTDWLIPNWAWLSIGGGLLLIALILCCYRCCCAKKGNKVM